MSDQETSAALERIADGKKKDEGKTEKEIIQEKITHDDKKSYILISIIVIVFILLIVISYYSISYIVNEGNTLFNIEGVWFAEGTKHQYIIYGHHHNLFKMTSANSDDTTVLSGEILPNSKHIILKTGEQGIIRRIHHNTVTEIQWLPNVRFCGQYWKREFSGL
jgi:hypothetical protein